MEPVVVATEIGVDRGSSEGMPRAGNELIVLSSSEGSDEDCTVKVDAGSLSLWFVATQRTLKFALARFTSGSTSHSLLRLENVSFDCVNLTCLGGAMLTVGNSVAAKAVGEASQGTARARPRPQPRRVHDVSSFAAWVQHHSRAYT